MFSVSSSKLVLMILIIWINKLYVNIDARSTCAILNAIVHLEGRDGVL